MTRRHVLSRDGMGFVVAPRVTRSRRQTAWRTENGDKAA